MSSPVKALIAPTGASFGSSAFKIPYIKSTVTKFNLTSASGGPDVPVIFNPLGFRFVFKTVAFCPDFTLIPRNRIGFPTIFNAISYAAVNTVPAVYQPTTLRPYFGQMWPRSGVLPY